MPIQDQTVEYDYVGDGVSVAFGFGSKFLNNADILVGLNGVLQVGGYAVTNAGNEAGGTVTFGVAPAVGVAVALVRKPPFSQLLTLTDNATVLQSALQPALDKLTMLTQYLLRTLNKAIRTGDLDGSTLAVLPVAAARAGLFLSFDNTGAPLLVAATNGLTITGKTMFTASTPGGSANAQTFVTDGAGALSAVARFIWVTPTVNNTNTMTIAFDGGAAVPVKSPLGNNLVANEWAAGVPYLLSATNVAATIVTSGAVW